MPNYDKLFAQAQQHLATGNNDDALELLDKCARNRNYKHRCLKLMGNVYAQQGKYGKAEDCFKKAVKIDNNDHELCSYLAMSMVFCDRSDSEILRYFHRSLEIKPDFAPAWYGAGSVYQNMEMYEEAKSYLSKAIELDSNHIHARINLATVQRNMGSYNEALEEYNNCIAINPSNIEALAGKAITLFHVGNINDAEELIRSLAGKVTSNPAVAIAYCEICKNGSNAYDALKYIEDTINGNNLTLIQKRNLYYSAAKLCDLLSEYDKAYNYIILANSTINNNFDSASFIKSLDQSRTNNVILLDKTVDGQDNSDIIPVFIVGMLRSGSTLVEQILSCHNDVSAGGEMEHLHKFSVQVLKKYNALDYSSLDSDGLSEIRRDYINELKKISNGKKYVTDKLPTNFERISLINAIFPEAKIINTTRNKLDVCVSCYFLNFGTRHQYTSDIKTLASVYRYYDELMSFWKEHSKIDIYDLSYEKLIHDQENQIRMLLDYLELPWSDACLEHYKSSRVPNTASFDQVRQPLYQSSIGRWRNYEKHIPELINAFGEG